MMDSREVPLQSMNIWYGATGGYGYIVPVAPDRLLETHDILGVYDPVTRKRTINAGPMRSPSTPWSAMPRR